MAEIKYDMAYMYKYSERPRTLAERKFEDNISEEVKSQRLNEIIAMHMSCVAERTAAHVGKRHKVLVEGVSKKSQEHYYGRNGQNVVVVFPKNEAKMGQYVWVNALSATAVTLIGEIDSYID
jgi:tRNA-2-methylthio-N6-dimethylallyladenosine synthase